MTLENDSIDGYLKMKTQRSKYNRSGAALHTRYNSIGHTSSRNSIGAPVELSSGFKAQKLKLDKMLKNVKHGKNTNRDLTNIANESGYLYGLRSNIINEDLDPQSLKMPKK